MPIEHRTEGDLKRCPKCLSAELPLEEHLLLSDDEPSECVGYCPACIIIFHREQETNDG